MPTIVVALDGSPRSEVALPYGVALAQRLHGRLELVHVLEEPVLLDLLPGLVMPDRSNLERYLQELAAQQPADVPISTGVVRGNAVDELLRVAAQTPDAMLVLATRARGAAGRAMLGSVADKVARGATVPVLLVPDESAPPLNWPHSIVVPLDGSPLGEQALPVAADLARATETTVLLARVADLYSIAPYVGPELGANDVAAMFVAELRDEARQYLEATGSRLRDAGVPVTWKVREGRPAQEIVRLVDESGADLVVMTSHGRGGLRRWALGSVADEILHHVSQPLLLTPARAVAATPSNDHEIAAASHTVDRA